MIRATVLVSGNGAQVQSLLDSAFFKEIPDMELCLICSEPDAYVLTRAKTAGVPCYVVERDIFPNGASFSLAVLNKLRDLDTDLVILSEFAYKLGSGAAHLYRGRALGLRPALVPAFDGVADAQLCAAAIERGVKLTGATAYLCDDEGNIGEIIAQRAIEIKAEDTPETLRRRMLEEIEWRLLPEIVRNMVNKLQTTQP